ncbi:MAG: hypothetical protein H0T78_02630 [Longispora sp.]|nr:hypothetical protein [Longispora sp. (in: high G+C Gram-positive bacteria)]
MEVNQSLFAVSEQLVQDKLNELNDKVVSAIEKSLEAGTDYWKAARSNDKGDLAAIAGRQNLVAQAHGVWQSAVAKHAAYLAIVDQAKDDFLAAMGDAIEALELGDASQEDYDARMGAAEQAYFDAVNQ